ncbi:MAG: MBL fold metallo-hydrolase [Caldisericaceae bacterium]
MGKIEIFDGANEIGGTKLFLEVAKSKFFFDFGLNYKNRGLYYEEFLNPRVANGIGDLYFLGLVPRLPGMYRTDLVQLLNRNGSNDLGDGSEQVFVNAVFLTHAHFDHSAYVALLREELPIYASPTTLAILKAMEESGNPTFENKMFEFKRRSPMKSGDEKGSHNFKTIAEKVPFENVIVSAYPVDHSIRGAVGYVVESPEGSIVYSGDLRLHGKRTEETLNFAANARKSKPKFLIIEGTNLRSENDAREFWTEQRVFDEAYEVFKKTKELIIADFSIRDTDRLLTFLTLSKVTGRKFVISLKDAYLLDSIHALENGIPDLLNDPDVYLYLEKHISGTYDEGDYNRKWMKDLLGRVPKSKLIKAEDIHSNQGNFVVTLRFFDLQELIDILPSKGSAYIHSSSEAHSEEQEIDQKRMDNWLAKFNLYPRFHVHASGHARKEDLFKLVDEIDPEVIIPVHTEHPEIYSAQFGNKVRIVNDSDKIEF